MTLATKQRIRLGQLLRDGSLGASIADILDAAESLSATESGYIDAITPGTAAASTDIILQHCEITVTTA